MQMKWSGGSYVLVDPIEGESNNGKISVKLIGDIVDRTSALV